MENVEFTYSYRDGGNYKKRGRVVFSNPDQLNVDSVQEELLKAFETDGLFIASQIRVPDVFLCAAGEFSFDDHCYHEFSRVQSTPAPANDANRRSLKEFLSRSESGGRPWAASF